MPSAPYIIIGMHRSGTSFLAKVLEKSGIFMGVVKDHNYEAMHFLSLNQQTLWAAGADWDNPKVPDKLYWKTIPAQELFYEHFKVNGKWARFKLKLRNPRWGWKEPRNTFTLPMWLDMFPQAKVLHIVREPKAVVASLQQRNQRKGEVYREKLSDDDFCLKLIDKYVSTARGYGPKLKTRFMEIEYEKLLARDAQTIRRLDKFCGISSAAAIKKLAK